MIHTKKTYLLIGLRNFLAVLTAAFMLLFSAEKILSYINAGAANGKTECDNEASIIRCYEKTPVESLLTVADARAKVKENDVDINELTAQISKYPSVDDMSSSLPADDGTVNILVFGDSFVYGEASLNRNELLWRRLEQRLREDGYNCRVTAIAMSGATAYEELGWYESCIEELKPDLAVFGYVYNDALIDGGNYGATKSIDYAGIIPVLRPIGRWLPNIYDRLSAYIDTKTMYSDKYGDKWENSNTVILKGVNREYYQKNFADKLDSITKEIGIPSVVMTLPNTPGSKMLREMYKPLKEIFDGTSVTYYNPVKEFDRFFSDKEHLGNLYVNPENMHPGSAAHYFYAEYLADRLEKDFAEALGKKSSQSLMSKTLRINDRTPYDINLKEISTAEEYAEYTFDYPQNAPHDFLFFTVNPYWLTYPLGKSYIKLSFENPVYIDRVELSGAQAGAEIYFTRINDSLGYDDNTLTPADCEDSGNGLGCSIDSSGVTSLCIHIDENSQYKNDLNLKIYSKG